MFYKLISSLNTKYIFISSLNTKYNFISFLNTKYIFISSLNTKYIFISSLNTKDTFISFLMTMSYSLIVNNLKHTSILKFYMSNEFIQKWQILIFLFHFFNFYILLLNLFIGSKWNYIFVNIKYFFIYFF